MTGLFQSQSLSDHESAIEYKKGLKMGLLTLKKYSNLTPEAIDRIIKTIEQEIKDDEAKQSLKHKEKILKRTRIKLSSPPVTPFSILAHL